MLTTSIKFGITAHIPNYAAKISHTTCVTAGTERDMETSTQTESQDEWEYKLRSARDYASQVLEDNASLYASVYFRMSFICRFWAL